MADVEGVEWLVKRPVDRVFFRLRTRLEFELNRRLTGRRVHLFSMGLLGARVRSHPLVRQADILHLHWVNAGFLSTATIGRLGKPVVWTLRDMWPFTGGCHYPMDCERYASGCGACPLYGATFAKDRTYWLFRHKKRSFSRLSRLYPVGISPWVAEVARRSPLFENREVSWIWNGVDLGDFPAIGKVEAREALKIDPQGSYFAFGAVNQAYPYKGYHQLREAVRHFVATAPHKGRVPGFLVFGRGGEDLADLGVKVRHFGIVRDNALLNQIYAAADAFLMPSVQEAFGKTIVEALSSGTPVVCFDATGPRDMIAHEKEGFKAKPFDPESFAAGMRWALAAGENVPASCTKAAQRFSHLAAARAYQGLYGRILSR